MKRNYLNNADLLPLLRDAKLACCQYLYESDTVFHATVDSIDEITNEVVEEAIQNAIDKNKADQKAKLIAAGYSEYLANKNISEPDIDGYDVVIRVYSEDHIDEAYQKGNAYRRKNPLPYPPFIHVRLAHDGWKIVLKSHHIDGKFNPKSPEFSADLTDKLVLLVNRLGTRGNWKNYSYLDDMKSEALIALLTGTFKFDEGRFHKPFTYLTKIAENAFKRYVDDDKVRHRQLKNELCNMADCFQIRSKPLSHKRYEH